MPAVCLVSIDDQEILEPDWRYRMDSLTDRERDEYAVIYISTTSLTKEEVEAAQEAGKRIRALSSQ